MDVALKSGGFRIGIASREQVATAAQLLIPFLNEFPKFHGDPVPSGGGTVVGSVRGQRKTAGAVGSYRQIATLAVLAVKGHRCISERFSLEGQRTCHRINRLELRRMTSRKGGQQWDGKNPIAFHEHPFLERLIKP